MSAYVNKMSLNIAEAATLTFHHALNTNNDPHNPTVNTMAMVTMPIECLRDVNRVITESLTQYDEQSKVTSPQRKGMN